MKRMADDASRHDEVQAVKSNSANEVMRLVKFAG
jgi:hypothetical protein